MRRKTLVIASAMLLAAELGSPVAAEQPSTDQLGAIAGYLESNDVDGLRAYLDVHPELTEGGTPLASLLRRFLVESIGGNEYFNFRPDLSDAVSSSQADEADSPTDGDGSAY